MTTFFRTATYPKAFIQKWLISELIPKINIIKELVARSEEWFLQQKLILPTKIILKQLIRSGLFGASYRLKEKKQAGLMEQQIE